MDEIQYRSLLMAQSDFANAERRIRDLHDQLESARAEIKGLRLTHIHDITKPLATPRCGATTGLCVNNDEATCIECREAYQCSLS